MNKRLYLLGGIIIIVIIVVFVGLTMMKPKSTSQSSQANIPAVNNSVVSTKNSSTLGQYLTDPSGRALYIYSKDSSGVSNCTGSCLTDWPAYATTGSTSNLPTGLGILTKSDTHQQQFTYNGMPLYYFVQDQNGQVTGNGQEGFTVAKPVQNAKTISNTSAQSATVQQSQSAPAPAPVQHAAASTPTPTPYSNSGSGW